MPNSLFMFLIQEHYIDILVAVCVGSCQSEGYFTDTKQPNDTKCTYYRKRKGDKYGTKKIGNHGIRVISNRKADM